MSAPEIFHRCPSCGASIRERAFFCPECGHQLEDSAEAETEASSEPTALPEPLPEPNSPPEITAPAKVELADQPVQPKTEVVQSDYRGTQRQRIQVRKSADRSQLRRNVEGELGQRVDRIRRISSEVLDQAGYDPSLRFILVALFLFVLFLVILIMSKFIR